MAESQLAHRQALETAVVNGKIRAEWRGQWMAFIIGVLAIVGGVGLIANGQNVSGLTAILGALTTLAGVFIYGRSQQNKELARKRQELEQLQLPLGP